MAGEIALSCAVACSREVPGFSRPIEHFLLGMRMRKELGFRFSQRNLAYAGFGELYEPRAKSPADGGSGVLGPRPAPVRVPLPGCCWA